MKLVVTGALGHIGSRFIRALRPGEFSEVVLVDNLSTQRYASLFDLPPGIPYRFVEDDVLKADLQEIFAGAHAVVHLAAAADAGASFEAPERTEEINFLGAERVARACADAGARLAFVSTTSVYSPRGDTVDEDCPDEDLRPQTPYADSKLRAEQRIRELGRSAGLRFVILRFGTIFGTSPGMRFHTAVNRFCWQASLGRPLTVWRTALEQQRPYLDLGDAVSALDAVIRQDLFRGETYNVLTENASVSRILELLRTFFPDLSVEIVDAAAMNALSYTVGREKFLREGFVYRGSLEAGVRETVRWLENAGASARRAPREG